MCRFPSSIPENSDKNYLDGGVILPVIVFNLRQVDSSGTQDDETHTHSSLKIQWVIIAASVALTVTSIVLCAVAGTAFRASYSNTVRIFDLNNRGHRTLLNALLDYLGERRWVRFERAFSFRAQGTMPGMFGARRASVSNSTLFAEDSHFAGRNLAAAKFTDKRRILCNLRRAGYTVGWHWNLEDFTQALRRAMVAFAAIRLVH
jgi:hypothetical protein